MKGAWAAIVACAVLGEAFAVPTGEKDYLWPDQGSNGPYLQWYEMPKGVTPTNVCAMIVSGGAYQRLGDVVNFQPYVDQLLSNGIQCACLFYRTPRPKTGPIYASAWADGQRAVRLLRHAATERGYDPERIGAVGGSAGGHLTVLLGASALTPAYKPVDALDETPCHLNWAVPICPAYVLTDGLTDVNAQQGEGAGVTVDPVFAFDAKTCPMCFFHGGKDVHSPLASTQLYRCLRRRGVPAEVHLDADRGHGFMKPSEFERALEFLRQLEILGRLRPEQNHDHRFFFDDTLRTEKEPLWPEGRTPDCSAEQTKPYLVWFVPEKRTTSAIQIIAPGGAYMSCNFNGECTPAAHYLNGKGMTAVVLMYRHPRPLGKPKYLSAWQDAQRAIRLVRAEAPRRGLDPDRIGFMGFSAGGHLTLMAAASSRTPAYKPVDETDRLPCNVQWACPIYPGYVLTDNNNDRLSTTGGNADMDVISPELRFDAATPPMCFVHGDADFVPAMNSVKAWEQLRHMGIQGDLHTLARRSHCFQIRSSPGTGSWTWLDRVWEFLNRKGILADPPASGHSDTRLAGDGVHDDTAAIQARLDSGTNCVYLPPPVKEYLISRPLVIGSDQELRLDRLTRIRLAPKSNCHMLVNRDRGKGNRRVAVTGGVWDYDNLRQKCNQGLWMISDDPEYNRPKYTDGKYRPDRYLGVAMYFENMTDLELSGVTFRNPVTYAAQFCKVSYFTVRDIVFDFTTWNPAKSNMDGVHFDGCCHHGRIMNLRGTCFDDMVALNANDVHCAAQEGPVTDIDIDGVYADYSHSAVRLLSTNADCPVKRITIRNVHGNFYRYAVGLTRLLYDRPGRGVMEDIVIENCFAASAPWPEDLPPLLVKYFHHMPVVLCDRGLDVRNLTIRNFHRVEKADPVPTVLVLPDAAVENFVCRDCTQENRTETPLVFLENLGTVRGKVLDNVRLTDVAGCGTNVLETTEAIWKDEKFMGDNK